MDPLRKLCLLGDFRVGKTRLVRQLTGRDQPPPEVGVHLHRWRCPSVPATEFALFDVAGRTALDSLGQSFLSSAEGFALVADCSEPGSIDVALKLNRAAQGLIGPRPAVLMLNKADRAAPPIADLPPGLPVFHVSARSGEGVHAAFAALAELVAKRAADAGARKPLPRIMGVP